jgi:hypothetical protein
MFVISSICSGSISCLYTMVMSSILVTRYECVKPTQFSQCFLFFPRTSIYSYFWVTTQRTDEITDILGRCISSCGFVTLSNNLFFTQIIKQSINYIFSSIIHDCLPTFGQVLDPTLEEIRRFGREEFFEPILELSAVVEGNSMQIVGERAEEVVIRWGKVRKGWRKLSNHINDPRTGVNNPVCDIILNYYE